MLIYIADEQRLFARNGLNVVIKDYDSGAASTEAMLKGEVDIAEASEFPFVRAIFQTDQIRVIGVNDKFENDYVVARKDRGIVAIPDLKGKRIGVTRQTINEFYLGRFLDLNGLSTRDVTVVDLKPASFVDAPAGGEVDAVVAWQPYVHQVVEKEGENKVVVWPAQSNQAVFGVLLSQSKWLAEHATTVERFLKSLAEAEDYLVRRQDKAMAIVQDRLGYDSAYTASVWPRHQFSLSLDYSLLVAMNDEAKWLMDTNQTTSKQVPDFSSNVYLAGMAKAKPAAVNIGR